MKAKLFTIAMTVVLMLTAMSNLPAQDFDGPCLPQMHGMNDHQSALCGVIQSIELAEGWNNISLFVEVDDPVVMLDILKEGLGENALTIEGSEGYTEFDGEEWFGDLDELGITNEQSYMINVLSSCTVELQGIPANPTDYEISISQGWNRIGFPSAVELEVEVALSEFAAEEGDMLEGPDGYTEFDGEEWFGDIEMMVPGKGYQYFSNSDEVKTLVFQTVGSKAKAKSGFFSGKAPKMSIERKVEPRD